MAPVVSLKQWPCCSIFIELHGVGFWIWKGLPAPALYFRSGKIQSTVVLTFRCRRRSALLSRTHTCSARPPHRRARGPGRGSSSGPGLLLAASFIPSSVCKDQCELQWDLMLITQYSFSMNQYIILTHD